MKIECGEKEKKNETRVAKKISKKGISKLLGEVTTLNTFAIQKEKKNVKSIEKRSWWQSAAIIKTLWHLKGRTE